MNTTDKNTSIFQHPVWVAILASTAAIVWGWAYPLIKIGFAEFQIEQSMTGSKMLFAGLRFCLSGIIILVHNAPLYILLHRTVAQPGSKGRNPQLDERLSGSHTLVHLLLY